MSAAAPLYLLPSLVEVSPCPSSCDRCPPLCTPLPVPGIPLSIIVKDYGWSTYFTTLIAACGMSLLLLSPMTNLRSHVQRQKARAAKLA